MKKLMAITLALMLALAAFAVPAMAEELIPAKVGMLTILNSTEEESEGLLRACAIAISRLIANDQIERVLDQSEGPLTQDYSVVFYDTLDAMLMALNAGDINAIYIYRTAAEYLCANNDQLAMLLAFDQAADTDIEAIEVYKNLVTSEFSFMLLEGREELRDALNDANDAVSEDGTLNRLVAEQIDAAIAGNDIAPVEMPVIDGAETVKVAVTGALPPMDYIAADGMPAGFNTALLAEISNRIGKNIELVVVDSVGRASALASGTVDVVFWTRASRWANALASLTEAEKEAEINRMVEGNPEAEVEVLHLLASLFPPETQSIMDIPEGTIITSPYYSDMILPVSTKAFMEIANAQYRQNAEG